MIPNPLEAPPPPPTSITHAMSIKNKSKTIVSLYLIFLLGWGVGGWGRLNSPNCCLSHHGELPSMGLSGE